MYSFFSASANCKMKKQPEKMLLFNFVNLLNQANKPWELA